MWWAGFEANWRLSWKDHQSLVFVSKSYCEVSEIGLERSQYGLISNSLIIHEENTKEINAETEFGYVMKHLHKIKPTSRGLGILMKHSSSCLIHYIKTHPVLLLLCVLVWIINELLMFRKLNNKNYHYRYLLARFFLFLLFNVLSVFRTRCRVRSVRWNFRWNGAAWKTKEKEGKKVKHLLSCCTCSQVEWKSL